MPVAATAAQSPSASGTITCRPRRSTAWANRRNSRATRPRSRSTTSRPRRGGRLRQALDPDQEGGSDIALPPDDELKADLASAHWELTARGIKLEPKNDIRECIGRSPGKGDAVVMAWAEGGKAVKRQLRRSRPLEIQGANGYDPHTGRYRCR
jgi:hypothetical protein